MDKQSSEALEIVEDLWCHYSNTLHCKTSEQPLLYHQGE